MSITVTKDPKQMKTETQDAVEALFTSKWLAVEVAFGETKRDAEEVHLNAGYWQ